MVDVWSLALTQPRCESTVAEFLTRYDYPFHWFRERHASARNGHVITALRPLFPQYIFVRARNEWDTLCSRTRIVGFVSFGGQLASVGEQIVRDLMVACPDDVAPQQEISCRFRRGDKVDIVGDGAFSGHTAVFLRTISPERSVLWIDIFGRSVPISIETDCVVDHIPGPMPKKWRQKRRWRNRYKARAERAESSLS
jgi:transcriptional antiterminator RfaH